MAQLARAQALLGILQPLDPGFAQGSHNDKLQTALDSVIHDNPELEPHAFAVVDLTSNPLAPAYAGHRDTEYKPTLRPARHIASMAKLLALYGAFQLRSHVRAISNALSITDITILANDVRLEYNRVGAAETARPWVEKIFTSGGPAGVDFVQQTKTDANLRPVHLASSTRRSRSLGLLRTNPTQLDFELQSTGAVIGQLPFREHVRLMAGWSDDVSAAVVIESLGYPYLWALATRSGLFRSNWTPLTSHDLTDPHAGGAGGLFLGLDYNGSRWALAPGLTRPPVNAPTMPPSQAGTARSAAVLMTALAQDRLVSDYKSHVEMREMLRVGMTFSSLPELREFSPIGVGMNLAGWSATQLPWDFSASPPPPDPHPDPIAPLATSKIGLLSDPIHNCSNALLVRTNRPKAAGTITITAVLVGLNNHDDITTPLQTFGTAMAGKLDEIHHDDP
jgi:hypothetical protein